MRAARHRRLGHRMRWAGKVDRGLRSERGSGSTLALAIIATTAALAIALLTTIGAFAAHVRV